MVSRGGIKFFPGAKLEAKDFSEKWYSARVVETDWAEREVLIHFDKWSSRFDEWIPMDSSRLRVLQSPPKETKMREFVAGERILATWADGRKYPAKVKTVLGNDRYDVLFDDGYAKIVRSSKMTKIAVTPEQRPIDEGYIGSKQERRDRKRKHSVMELFHSTMKKRSRTEFEKSVQKERPLMREDDGNYESADLIPASTYDSGTELLKGFERNKPKVKTYAKKKRKELSKTDTDNEDETGPEWVDGEPQGKESYIVDSNDGSRRSIIVADKRLPTGWQKHFTQRRTGTSAGKWDVLFIQFMYVCNLNPSSKPSGKKFRSRNDIRTFMEQQGQFDFEPDKFDFCIHRKKNNRNNFAKLRQEPSNEIPKKIKTLLPKAKIPMNVPESTPVPVVTVTTASPETTPVIPMESGAVFIGTLRVEMEDSAYKCPKEGCKKTFRKENLLQMHIKHYHPEYSKFLGSTPNVADLAYARTIGESVEDIIPKKTNSFMDKINKFERKKTSHEKNVSVSESEPNRPEKTFGSLVKDDSKTEVDSPLSSQCVTVEEETLKKREANCAMSPGTLFDLKIRDEKTQTGIKTLLPVRPVLTPIVSTNVSMELQKSDMTKPTDAVPISDKGKSMKKRPTPEHNLEMSVRYKKKQGMQDQKEDVGDLDESTVDIEGPATPTYRFSRRKSDPKSDENSQTSQLYDSHIEKGETPKGDAAKNDIINDAEDGDGAVMMMINGELVKVEQLRREEIINCTCGFMEEDGLMIQCDLCLCWQHGHCNSIEREKDVPEKYVCYICLHPYRQRRSKKYIHDQDWIKEGELPSLPNRPKNHTAINLRTAMLKRSYDLVAALLQIQQILHSLRVKINVAEKKDHPKLYLWAKNWEKSEILPPMTEPVPLMKIVEPSFESTESSSDSTPSTEVKTEVKEEVKEEPDKKSIASDTELMKILEEDSLHSEDVKNIKKHEIEIEGHILLDALTRINSEPKSLKPHENTDAIPNGQVSTSTSDDMLPLATGKAEPSTDLDNVLSLQPFVPEPEAPIDPAECRMRLLEHVEHFQNHIDNRLISIEAQVIALEAMDPDDSALNSDVLPRTKQTMQMLLRDLATVRKLASLC